VILQRINKIVLPDGLHFIKNKHSLFRRATKTKKRRTFWHGIDCVDILPALKGRDSSCETLKSERENVLRRVDIAVVSHTALTHPFSYSKTCSTFRTAGGDDSAARTGLGGVPFWNLQIHN